MLDLLLLKKITFNIKFRKYKLFAKSINSSFFEKKKTTIKNCLKVKKF